MKSFARHRYVRLTLIVLYAMAMALVGAASPTNRSFTVSEREIVLPGGQIAAFCHTTGTTDDNTLPGDGDHRSCCAACVIAGAPGLVALLQSEFPLPRQGKAVEAGFIVSERSAIQLRRPTSRGPPTA